MAVIDVREAARPRALPLTLRLRAVDVALGCTAAAFIAELVFFVFFGYLNRDEGWYVLSGRLVAGGQLPYRDFPYFQTPLLPYVFAAMEQVFGSTIIAGRLIGLSFAIVTLALVVYIAQRLGGRWAAVIAAGVLVATPDFMLASVAARSEAVVIPLTLAALAAALARPRGLAGFALPPALLLIASLARLSFLPAFALTAAYCSLRARPSRREAAIGGALFVAIALAGSLPFLIAAPHATIFDVWTAQAARNGQFTNVDSSVMQEISNRVWSVQLPWSLFFAGIAAALFAAVLMAQRWRDGWRPGATGFGGDILSNYALMIGFALIIWAPFFGFDHQEDRYFLPSFGLLAILGADLAVRSARGRLGESARLAAPVLGVLLAGHALFQLRAAQEWVDRGDLTETQAAGGYINGLMGPGDQLVTFNPTLAVAADRTVAPELVMGQFAFWPYKTDGDAGEHQVLNATSLEGLMLDPKTKVIALDDYDLSLIALTRDETPLFPASTAWPYKLYPSLARDFDLVRVARGFGQFSGTLYILERRTAG